MDKPLREVEYLRRFSGSIDTTIDLGNIYTTVCPREFTQVSAMKAKNKN